MEKLRFMRISRMLCWILVSTLLVNCGKSEYQQYVEKELATGISNDSLIFNMHMGQTRKEFYETCWELNKQQLVSQGAGNNSARFITDRDHTGRTTPRSKDMLFYGIFDDNKIMRGMNMTYSYLSWSPWNESLQADSLLLHLRDEYALGYPGNDFIEINIKEAASTALVKIDGNRQILMYPKNDKDVAVLIEDLNYKLKKQWKKE